MIRLHIDGNEVTGREGQTILSLARENNIHIPTLCHDDRVAPQGACGLCIVEPEGSPRLLRACATVISEGMVIHTQSPRVRASRKAALELLLSAHTGDCRPPCMRACPAQTDCQGYIGLIANGQYDEAVKLMKDAHPLPASVGRICPHPCEKECRRTLAEEPVNIAALKYFAADREMNNGNAYLPETQSDTNKTVAIVGGGPAGLTAAYFLQRAGHRVVVYDALPQMGGLLRYGIPAYRLPKHTIDAELDTLTRMGIVFINNTSLGRDITLDTLRKQYDAVVIATGAGLSKKMNCPGEMLDGVLGGIDFLRETALGKPVLLGNSVVVVGGSNTAMDAARTAVRLGAKTVYVAYRRSREEMPADPAEVKEAEEEGVQFKFLTNPIEITGENGRVGQVRLQRMTLGEPDAGGRRSPVPVAGDEEWLDADTVIAAIGQDINLQGMTDLPVTRRGALNTSKDTYFTGMEGVYAIGDVTGQSAYAIEAIGHARKAAAAIHNYLSHTDTETAPPWEVLPGVLVKDVKTKQDFINEPRLPRENAAQTDVSIAKSGFDEVSKGLTEDQALREAKRCLACGCGDYYECKLLRYANDYHADPAAYADGHVKPRRVSDTDNPYFRREPDKCILCGLCVRVCDEVMGHTALGMLGRGFGTEVAPMCPSTDCTNCGQCVALCPTGALQENLPLTKTIVVREETADSVCAFCGVGCRTRLTHKGGLLLRSLPDTEHDPQALLCEKGRFAFARLNQINRNGERLTQPLIRDNEQLTGTDWPDALEIIRTRMEELTARYGADAVGVAVAEHLSLEDMRAIKAYATQTLGTPHLFTLSGTPSGLADVTGRDASTANFNDVAEAEVILLAADDIMASHPVAGIHIKKAVENGAKLINLAKYPTQADEWAALSITTDDDLSILRQLTKAVMECSPACHNMEGYEALRNYVSGAESDADVAKAAAFITNARKAVIVYDQKALTISAARLLANITVIAGLNDGAHTGVIQLKQHSNSQGLCDLGISTDMLHDTTLKGLIVFGGDASGDATGKVSNNMANAMNGLEFLAVCDLTLTEITKKADVVLPAAAFTESAGHYTDTVGVTKFAQAVHPPVTGMTNRQIALALGGTC